MYVSSKDIGIDSTFSSLHEGHTSTKLCILLGYDAHQKHELHIKKFLSLEAISRRSEYGFFKSTLMFIVSIFLCRNMLEYKIPEYTAIWLVKIVLLGCCSTSAVLLVGMSRVHVLTNSNSFLFLIKSRKTLFFSYDFGLKSSKNIWIQTYVLTSRRANNSHQTKIIQTHIFYSQISNACHNWSLNY